MADDGLKYQGLLTHLSELCVTSANRVAELLAENTRLTIQTRELLARVAELEKMTKPADSQTSHGER